MARVGPLRARGERARRRHTARGDVVRGRVVAVGHEEDAAAADLERVVREAQQLLEPSRVAAGDALALAVGRVRDDRVECCAPEPFDERVSENSMTGCNLTKGKVAPEMRPS